MKIIPVTVLFAAMVLLHSCGTGDQTPIIIASEEKIPDTMKASCPYLTKDNENNIVLTWIREIDTSRSVFCFSVSKDSGYSFSNSIEIPGSSNVYPHGENLPKIIFKPSGEILAAWGASNPNPNNPYSGLVFYSQSFDNGKTWTKASSISKDTSSIDQRYFDVSLMANGEIGIVWLDNRKKSNKEGSGLYYAVTSGRNGFQHEQLIAEPCCQCCRTVLSVDKKKNIHVVYRAIINDSIRDMVHIKSEDHGQTFSLAERISEDDWVVNGCPHTGPSMAVNDDGLHLAWFTGGKNPGVYYNHSADDGISFSKRDSVSGRSAKHCQITSMENNNLLIVWNETFNNGGKVTSRIGLQYRDRNGRSLLKQYITPENTNASFPVLAAVSKNKIAIAYTSTTTNHSSVCYRLVSID